MVFESRIIGFQHFPAKQDKKPKFMFFTAKPINSGNGCGLQFNSNQNGGFNPDIYFVNDDSFSQGDKTILETLTIEKLLSSVYLLVGSKDYGSDHFDYEIKEL